MTVDNRPLSRGENEPHIINPKFKRKNPPPPPPIRQRDIWNPRNTNDQQIKQPFHENYVDDEGEAKYVEDQIHNFGDLDCEIYLTEEEHSRYSHEDDNKDLEEELDIYQRGYMHAMDDVQIKIKLISRDVTIEF